MAFSCGMVGDVSPSSTKSARRFLSKDSKIVSELEPELEFDSEFDSESEVIVSPGQQGLERYLDVWLWFFGLGTTNNHNNCGTCTPPVPTNTEGGIRNLLIQRERGPLR